MDTEGCIVRQIGSAKGKRDNPAGGGYRYPGDDQKHI